MADQINKLDTAIINNAILSFKEKIKEYEEIKLNIDKITTDLLHNWAGKSRNSYEVQYNLIKRNMDDITDELYDIYNGMADSIGAYMETDIEISNRLRE